MTSLAIAEGWNMIGTGPRDRQDWSNWREVVAAWIVAAVLASALLVSVPRHDRPGPPASLWSLSPTADGHAYKRAPDAEGPTGDQACSDRDYVNELC
jgi:hypothetical protein